MVEIKSVIKKSPADKAGLKGGDLLLKVNSHEINDFLDYQFYTQESRLTIEAKAQFSMEVTCDRCAEDIRPEFTVDIEHGLVASLNHEDNDDYILIEDMKLDVRQLTLEDIYLALPGKFLCKEDCEGLCPECGANLNESSCDCKKPIDPRLEALKKFLE